MSWSLLIKNGALIDGSGEPPVAADVALSGDRIAAIGPNLQGEAARVIDATGLTVAPGFIDIHSHSDFFYAQCPSAESKVRQGVTTEVVGMCSFSPAPIAGTAKGFVEATAGAFGSHFDTPWQHFGEYLAALAARDLSVNVVHFVGHGAMRFAAMGGDNRAPTTAELDRMIGFLGEALDAGAFGFSTGLVYPPSAFSETEELIALARSMAKRGGIYFTHMRGEADTVVDAVDEAVRICDEGGVPLQIAHIKAFGRSNWPLMDGALGRIEAARQRGLPVTADVYPYIASSTVMTSLLPGWVQSGGTAKLLERLADPAQYGRLLKEQQLADGEWQTISGSVAWSEVMVATCPETATEGKTIAELAAVQGRTGGEVMLDLLRDNQALVSMVVFSQSEANVEKAVTRPYVMIGSDSLGLSCGAGPHRGKPHPRMYGTFPRVFAQYVREKRVLTNEAAVAKMTGQPAAKLGLKQRGLLRENYFADVTIFDAARIADRATFQDPHQHPAGIPFVIVNGKVVVDAGAFHAAPAGRVLKH